MPARLGGEVRPGTTTVNMSATDTSSNTGHGSLTVTYAWSSLLSPFPKGGLQVGTKHPDQVPAEGSQRGAAMSKRLGFAQENTSDEPIEPLTQNVFTWAQTASELALDKLACLNQLRVGCVCLMELVSRHGKDDTRACDAHFAVWREGQTSSAPFDCERVAASTILHQREG